MKSLTSEKISRAGPEASTRIAVADMGKPFRPFPGLGVLGDDRHLNSRPGHATNWQTIARSMACGGALFGIGENDHPIWSNRCSGRGHIVDHVLRQHEIAGSDRGHCLCGIPGVAHWPAGRSWRAAARRPPRSAHV